MRQSITFEQWSELNEKKKIKWFNTIHFDKENTYKSFEAYFNDRSPEYEWSISDEIKHQENSFGDFTEGLDINLPNIGEMIEFLGDDLGIINFECSDSEYVKMVEVHFLHKFRTFEKEYNLCDVLWEAVKYKLNN